MKGNLLDSKEREGLQQHAINYTQKLSWYVLPVHSVINGCCTCGQTNCKNAGKHPTIKDWPNQCSIDQSTVTKWWSQWPSPNIAVATGKKSNITVLDFDGEEGQKTYEKLKPLIPNTPTQKTGKGLHVFFRYNPKLQTTVKILPGLDIRNDKGYIIVAPSTHPSGNKYEWLVSPFETEPAELPEGLLMTIIANDNQKYIEPPEEIPEGERHNFFKKYIPSLFGRGLEEEEVRQKAFEINKNHCKPPLDQEEIESIINWTAEQEKTKKSLKRVEPTKPNTATKLVKLAKKPWFELELFKSTDNKPYATYKHNNHYETHPIKQKSFHKWLRYIYYKYYRSSINDRALKDAANQLAADALFGDNSKTYEVFVRVGEHKGNIYIDLGNDKWQAVEITKEGWRIIDTAPVRFKRPSTMHPLPPPEPGGDIERLQKYFNTSPGDFFLVLSWILTAFKPKIAYPILALNGVQGSAKSTTARLLKALIDPSAGAIRALPQNERDLIIAANNSWVLNFDNLSFIKPEFSDALCRIATGAGFSTRELYTDDNEMVFEGARPIIINSIPDVVTRPDLLDRAVMVELPAIPQNKRKTVKAIWSEFEREKPKLLGAILNLLVHGLQRIDKIESDSLPRMADYAKWSEACLPQMIAKLRDHEKEKKKALAESEPFVQVFKNFFKMKKNKWEGTLAELRKSLVDANIWPYGTEIPQSARKLNNIIKRIAPLLQEEGIRVKYKKVQGNRLIELSAGE